MSMPKRQVVALSVAVAALVVIGPAMFFLHREMRPNPDNLWPLLGKYCGDCHNRDDLTAGIAFDKMSPADIAREPEVFEAAIRKLRGNQMPPPGSTRPTPETRDSLVRWFETTLDAAAERSPKPGRVALHRLNRTEYANAVEDLTGLKVDVAALLP